MTSVAFALPWLPAWARTTLGALFAPTEGWLDEALFAAMVALLVGAFFSPRSNATLLGFAALVAFFFGQDVGRVWPSFYQYWLLLLCVALARVGGADGEAVLAMCWLNLGGVYFHAGVQKLVPSFAKVFGDLYAPFLALVGVDQGSALVAAIAFGAAAGEALMGVAVLLPPGRLRTLGIGGAVLMHLHLLGMIGPFRNLSGAFSDSSAWIYSFSECVLLLALCYTGTHCRFSLLRTRGMRLAVLLTVLLVWVAPFLDFVLVWPPNMSFNVFTQNIPVAYIRVGDNTTVTAHLAPFVQEGWLSLWRWAASAFYIIPLPMRATCFKTFEYVCNTSPDPTALLLYFQEKPHFWNVFNQTLLEGSWGCSMNPYVY